jgi:hypothetical protein
MAYLLDANVFTGAKNLHYGLDFCPAFWDWLIAGHATATVFSVERFRTRFGPARTSFQRGLPVSRRASSSLQIRA